ncbi:MULTISPECIES: PepSY domain-containing protein [unclassified Geodermatophilus]|uniref:PepSY domain-containing protein n=1 Tax=unclassified Geodermatophilus TaxID=2637632 RepID=UPI003EEACD32
MSGGVQQQVPPGRARARGWIRSAALVFAGLVAGGVIAGTLVANAAFDGPRDGTSFSRDDRHHDGDGHHDEQPLTGETAEQVRAVALDEYPGATIRRLETDSDGVYEAHLVTSDGRRVTVEVNAQYEITGIERGGR